MERLFTVSQAAQVFLFNGDTAAAVRNSVIIRIYVGSVVFQPHNYAVIDLDNNVSSCSPAEGYAVFRCLLGIRVSGSGVVIPGSVILSSFVPLGLGQDDFFK